MFICIIIRLVINMLCYAVLYSASVFFLTLCSTTYAASHDRHVSNIRRLSGYCGFRNFQCDSGQCITEDNLCDGKPDCRDNSDETRSVCSDIICPRFIYRCNYGACVKKRARCDGIRDCYDGSDEISCGFAPASPTTEVAPFTTRRPVVPTSRPIQPINCLIPNDPDNGIYTIGGRPPEEYITGDPVPPYSVLVTNCDKDYQPSPSNDIYSVCANGIWTPLPSTCSRSSTPTIAPSPPQCHCYC